MPVSCAFRFLKRRKNSCLQKRLYKKHAIGISFVFKTGKPPLWAVSNLPKRWLFLWEMLDDFCRNIRQKPPDAINRCVTGVLNGTCSAHVAFFQRDDLLHLRGGRPVNVFECHPFAEDCFRKFRPDYPRAKADHVAVVAQKIDRRAEKISCPTAARMPLHLLAVMHMPIPVPQTSTPRFSKPLSAIRLQAFSAMVG